jgi:uncharacterized DUF497 family protein
MRFDFDQRKRLKENPQRGIGFEEAQELFSGHSGSINDRMFPSNIALSDG